MNEKYFPEEIEEKQQRRWAEVGAFNADVNSSKPKFYCLEMLPYPSGRIHMGHVRNYSIGDALSAYKRMQGFNVLCERRLYVRVPIVPGVPARMFGVGVRNVQLFEVIVEAAIMVDQHIFRAAIEAEARHPRLLYFAGKGIDV